MSRLYRIFFSTSLFAQFSITIFGASSGPPFLASSSSSSSCSSSSSLPSRSILLIMEGHLLSMRATTLLLLLAFVCDRRKEEEEEAEEGGISSPPVGLRRRKKEESCWWRKSRNRKKEEGKKGLRSPSHSLHRCQLFFFRRESFGRERGEENTPEKKGTHTLHKKSRKENPPFFLPPSARFFCLLCVLWNTMLRFSVCPANVVVLVSCAGRPLLSIPQRLL